MLAILMGLVAWVLDALISWLFFPGKSYFELLWAYDPGRTLYMRSVVVLLFFLFGMFAGHLMSKLEKSQRREEENVRLLRGVVRIHEGIVQETDARTLLDVSANEIRETFGFDRVFMRLLDPKSGEVLEEIRLPREVSESMPDSCVNCFRRRMESFADEGGLKVSDCTLDSTPHTCYSTPLRLGERTFGLFVGVDFGQSPPKEKHAGYLRSICDDLGHALARLRDSKKLAENADKLDDLYQNAPVGIFATTVGGNVLFLNRFMARILGGDTQEEILERVSSAGEFYTEPGRREDFLQEITTEGWLYNFEAKFKGLDGRTRAVRLAARLTDATRYGDPVIEGFAMDVTDAYEMEAEKEVLQKRLEQARHFKSITVLAGGIAHEFNNILQAMMGSAYLAQMRFEPESPTWQYMQDIQDSGNRAARLCDQMLSYAGKKAMLLKVEEADSRLQEISIPLKQEAPPSVGLEITLGAPSAEVRLDRASFSEIVNNMVLNAYEAMEKRNGRVVLETGIASMETFLSRNFRFTAKPSFDEDPWYLLVKDEGVGIAMEEVDKIFEPFYTTKFQGRGLGLSAVAGMVKKLDGSIGVKSVPGEGAEFVLLLPLARSAIVEREEAEPPAADAKQLEGHGTVWVVDDEPLICNTIERLLNRWGFEVHTALNGSDALERMKDDPAGFDCVIMDVTMPKMGGLETMRRLREFKPEVPVLIMSGFDEQQSLENFKDLDVAGFIHKPFQMEQLQAKLKRVLPDAAFAKR